ncbi:MAG TPA: IPT/TIG domain-containing protein, partial [Thermoanaerobaculia bacterium]|nr:IPT/TIG domain-containing protein [Thermoanaerobaculia bacterium]
MSREPITFEPNRGQFDGAVDFVSRGPGYSVAVAASGSTSRLETSQGSAELTMTLAGANSSASALALDPAVRRTNYFRGSRPEQWLMDIPSFKRVRYTGVYDGIAVEYFGRAGYLEYDFIVEPGADAGQISFHFEGARAVCVDDGGTVIIDTAAGELRHLKPFAYQTAPDGSKRRIAAEFDVADGRVGFAIGEYDRSRELVIDPSIVYTHDVQVESLNTRAIAVDSAGNVILTGQITSVALPPVNAVRPTVSGGGTSWEYEAFVMKISPLGTILYSTYLGGDGEDDGINLAVDASGNAYVVGRTRSGDFPTTASAYQRSLSLAWTTINWDLFVTKLSPAGALVYSTYLGGEGGEEPKDIALGLDGSVYVAGYLDSGSFPITVENRAQMETHLNHGGFVTRLSADGSSLIYSTVLPVSSDAHAIAVNASGEAYITGAAFESRHFSFPTTAGAFARYCTTTDRDGYCRDAYVMKLDASGEMQLSTFLPGLENETGQGIALDSAGNVHVVGETLSGDFPVTGDAFQREKWADGIYDGFYVKLDGSLSTLLYGTFLGGDHWDDSTDVIVDSSDRVTVKGDASDGFEFVNPFLYTASDGPTSTVLTQFNALEQVQFSVGFPAFSSYKFAVDSAGYIYAMFGNRIRKINPGGSSTDLILWGIDPAGRSNLPSDSFDVYCEAGEFDSGSIVRFGSAPATGVTLDNWSKKLSGTVPVLGAGLYDITVTTASGKTGTFPRGYEVVAGTFSIGSISPSTVAAGSRGIVTITGSGIPPAVDVTFGGPSPSVPEYTVRSHRVNGTTIQAFVPHTLAAGVYNVNVLPNGSTFNKITLSGALTVTGPRVYGLDPPIVMSNGGASVNVEAPYEDVFNGTTVSIDGIPGTMGSYHSSGVYVTVPAHTAGRVNVQVNTPLGSVLLPGGLLYVQSVSADTVSPVNGPPSGGTFITITGSGFVTGARVTINGLLMTDATVVNSTTITATTPPHPPGVVTIGVRNPDGGYGQLRNDSMVSNDQFTYDGPAPSSASVRSGFPNFGTNVAPATGGTGIRVDGTGFAAGARVFFGNQEATVTLLTVPNYIEATTPAHPEGLADLIVMNPTGETGRKDRSFVF